VKEVGCAIIGQTADLAPADKTLYGIRDITGTVESLDLITASILSKKLAAGLDALVLDVKTGPGAFMAREDDARALAASLVSVANGGGVTTSALLTDMNQPLAPCAGNAIEVRAAVDYLTGRAVDPRLHAVTRALAVEMVMLGGLFDNAETAGAAYDGALSSGAAAERFAKMVSALGGPADFIEKMNTHLEAVPLVKPVLAEQPGYVSAIDTRALGIAVVALGGGRRVASDPIDYAVGLSDTAGIGAMVGHEVAPLALVHARDAAQFAAAEAAVRAAYTLTTEPPSAPAPVLDHVSASDAERAV